MDLNKIKNIAQSKYPNAKLSNKYFIFENKVFSTWIFDKIGSELYGEPWLDGMLDFSIDLSTEKLETLSPFKFHSIFQENNLTLQTW